MTYRAQYGTSVGLYNQHGSGTYKVLTESGSGNTSVCYVTIPKDVTTRDIFHIRCAASTSGGAAVNIVFTLTDTVTSWSSATTKQAFTIAVNTTDYADYPVVEHQVAVASDVVTDAGNNLGFRLWGKASASISGSLLIRGLQVWIEKRP